MGHWILSLIVAVLFATLGAACEYHGVIADPAVWAFYGYLFGAGHAVGVVFLAKRSSGQ